VSHLHAQAVGLQNIRLVVMIILKPSLPQYKRWHDLVLLTLHHYTLDDHILSDFTDLSIYWVRLDNIMVIWILDTLSPELHEIIRELTETARKAWLAMEAQFLSNRESCVLQLDIRFCVFKLGDLSISDYYWWMKGMADIHALGETVTDCHLILNHLHGMNKRFNHMKIFIKRSQPFPSLHIICNDLKLKEIALENSAAQGQASTFYFVPTGGGRCLQWRERQG
jgi:hypothetical protein